MVLISLKSIMIKNVTLIKIVTYSRQIRLVFISASHGPRKKISRLAIGREPRENPNQ